MSKPGVEVTGIMLRGVGIGADCKLVVEVEIGGQWYPVIEESASNRDTISHIVEPSGIRKAVESARS